jgi:mannitol/fructose-specific phosphotransferase system IIA component (Ntr-type)
MNISRFMKPELIKLELEYRVEVPGEGEFAPKLIWEIKCGILEELVDLLALSGEIRNRNKAFQDLYNRERKATTGLGHGIAIPHVRTIQAKSFVIGFARSRAGHPFDSLDGKPVHVFFPMLAPPYDDSLYLRVFKSLAELVKHHHFMAHLMEAETAFEVMRAIRNLE